MRKYQVFVSSTYEDLIEERQACIRALLELDCIPAGMELFPASNDDAWTLIKDVIENSDYFILVVKGRYGTVHPDRDVSYTEMEYDYAVSRGIPVIALLWADLSTIPVNKSETDEAMRLRLARFREKAKERLVKWWSNVDQLSGLVSSNLATSIRVRPGTGWVRATDADIEAPKQQVEILGRRIRNLEAALQSMSNYDPLSIAGENVRQSYVSMIGRQKFTKNIPCHEALSFIFRSLPGYTHLSEYVHDEREAINAFFGGDIKPDNMRRFLKALAGYGAIQKKKQKWKVLPYGKQIKSLIEVGQ